MSRVPCPVKLPPFFPLCLLLLLLGFCFFPLLFLPFRQHSPNVTSLSLAPNTAPRNSHPAWRATPRQDAHRVVLLAIPQKRRPVGRRATPAQHLCGPSHVSKMAGHGTVQGPNHGVVPSALGYPRVADFVSNGVCQTHGGNHTHRDEGWRNADHVPSGRDDRHRGDDS